MSPVLHVDLDQFLAAVELLRRPELAGRPVVVGGDGDPTRRGVVSTANYEARAYGVGSGTPLRIAARKCPDAVFLPVDKAHYEVVSARVFDAVRSVSWGGLPVLVQVLGWDEGFIGADPAAGPAADPALPEPPEIVAERVRTAIRAAEGLTSCVGIGDNKLQAKLATGFAKPRPGAPGEPRIEGIGVHRIDDDSWYPTFGPEPTTALWGIGKRTALRLEEIGIRTVLDLARAEPTTLAAAFGPTTGPWLRRLGRGIDPSPVDPTPWVPRGHGREETFQTDLTSWGSGAGEVAGEVARIARRVTEDIHAEGRPAVRVELKLRYANFHTLTRSHRLPAATSDPDLLAAEAVALLARVDQDRPVRLLGVRLEMAD